MELSETQANLRLILGETQLLKATKSHTDVLEGSTRGMEEAEGVGVRMKEKEVMAVLSLL